MIDWLCIQYINICGYFINNNKDNLWIDLYSKISDGMNRPIFSRCPYITYNKIYRKYFSRKDEFVKFIEESIDNNEYIYLHINPNNISIYNLKDRILNIHECLISGYDNETKEFLCSDFFNSPIYKFEKITYDELFQAFISLKYQADEHIVDSIYTIKTLNKKIEFDYYSYYIMFCEYIGKRDCSLCVLMGLHVYDLIEEFLNECKKSKNGLSNFFIIS